MNLNKNYKKIYIKKHSEKSLILFIQYICIVVSDDHSLKTIKFTVYFWNGGEFREMEEINIIVTELIKEILWLPILKLNHQSVLIFWVLVLLSDNANEYKNEKTGKKKGTTGYIKENTK